MELDTLLCCEWALSFGKRQYVGADGGVLYFWHFGIIRFVSLGFDGGWRFVSSLDPFVNHIDLFVNKSRTAFNLFHAMC